MIALFKHKRNRAAVRIATLSFCLGTLLMLIALMTDHSLVFSLGILFIIIYIPVTLMMLLVLLINTLSHFEDIHEHVMTLIIVLMNIPIAVLYLNFLNHL